MSKKILKCLFSFIVFILGITLVNAEVKIDDSNFFNVSSINYASVTSVTVNGSIMTIHSTGSVSGYYVGTTSNFNATTTNYYQSNKNTYYIGVKNGTYYVWVQGGSSSSGSTSAVRYQNAINVTSSCNNNSNNNINGSADVERCISYDSKGNVTLDSGGSVKCASGQIDSGRTQIKESNCSSAEKVHAGQTLEQGYCTAIVSFYCTSGGSSGGGSSGGGGGGSSVPAATLSSMTPSSGSLSPGFSSGTKQYTLNVGAEVSSIHFSFSSNNGTVNGGNEQDFDLSFGSNVKYFKVTNSAGRATTYTVDIIRDDSRSGINTLSNLTVSQGTLSPAFSSDVSTYSLTVDGSVDSIDVGATLTDGSSHFEDGYGPRSFNLEAGNNIIDIVVVSARGNKMYYTINAYKETDDPSCSSTKDSKALLKSFKFTYGGEDYDYDLAPEFDPQKMTYTAKVPYKIGNISVEAFTQDEGDRTDILGGSNLEVNVEQDVSIKVTSKSCPSITKVYHVGVTRQPQVVLGTNPNIDSMTIDNHSEFKFEQNTEVYKIKLHKNETALSFNTKTEEDGTTCTYDGNENLRVGSKIEITCYAEDGEQFVNYEIQVTGIEKGSNVFLIVIIIIIVLFIIIYLILRLLGYKIYFNFEVIGSFFRGIGEKFRNIFDK